ncbi:MAG: hypothetical protein HY315_04075 [Acidobacteria bacterium]|nr:hypothetical protein [Acidobacteriota bacterium]
MLREKSVRSVFKGSFARTSLRFVSFSRLGLIGLLAGFPPTAAVALPKAAAASSTVVSIEQLSLATEQAPQKSPQPSRERARISVGAQTGDPGTVTVVPVRFILDGDVHLEAAQLEVSYPANALDFVEVDNELPEKITVKADRGAEEGRGTATVRIQFKPAPKSVLEFLPGGLAAYLVFKIREEAPTGEIPLRTSGQATLAQEPSGKAEPLATVDGKVKITVPRPSIYGCFFYMH